MSNIIDSIQVSGVTYTIQGSGGGGNPTVELTQAEYDALVTAGTVAEDTYYIITDAQAGDLTQYWTSAQTQSAITAAVSGKASQSDLETVSGQVANKQDTLVSGTNIKTINNESILGSGNIDIQGGGGTTYSAGTNISIANDTINCTLPISARTNSNIEYGSVNNTFSYNSGQSNKVDLNHLNGTGNTLTNSSSAIGGLKNNFINGVTNTLSMNGIGGNLIYNFINGETNQLTSDTYSKPSISYNFINGTRNTGDTTNYCIISGLFNEFKKSHQNLFGNNLIGNNGFETVFGQYNVSSSASTTFGNSGNTIFSIGNGTSSARHNAFEIRQNGDIYLSLNGQDVKLQDQLGGGSTYTAGDGIDITNDVISVTGKVDTSAITTSITSGSTDAQVPSAKAVNDKLGGLSLVKLTQAEYDDLVTKDNSTLYVIVN